MTRLRCLEPLLPMPRVWLHGPKWRRAFGVQHLSVAEALPALTHPADKKFYWYDFEDDVRELVCEAIRPDVYAMWSDPRERRSPR